LLLRRRRPAKRHRWVYRTLGEFNICDGLDNRNKLQHVRKLWTKHVRKLWTKHVGKLQWRQYGERVE
jgi:hypothetical protein